MPPCGPGGYSPHTKPTRMASGGDLEQRVEDAPTRVAHRRSDLQVEQPASGIPVEAGILQVSCEMRGELVRRAGEPGGSEPYDRKVVVVPVVELPDRASEQR